MDLVSFVEAIAEILRKFVYASSEHTQCLDKMWETLRNDFDRARTFLVPLRMSHEHQSALDEIDRAVREANLVAKLSELGCELRSDSKLCNDYIATGKGDPADIARVLREMRFYFDETRYAEFRDRAFQRARARYHEALYAYEDEYFSSDDDDDDAYVFGEFRSHRYRPPFSSFFDPQHASECAQKQAFAAWLAEHEPAETVALRHATLPESLRRRVWRTVLQRRARDWVMKVARLRATKHVVQDVQRCVLLAYEDDVATSRANEDDFERRLGDRLRALVKMDDAAAAATRFLGARAASAAAKGDGTARNNADVLAKYVDDARQAISSASASSTMAAPVAPHRAASVLVAAADAALRELNGRKRPEYNGDSRGALLRALRDATRADGAARAVQRAWREASANPEFAACRHRLMREAAEMGMGG
jgi:hypothetical protein